MSSNLVNAGTEEYDESSGPRGAAIALALRPLPRPLAALIGRQREVEEALDLLRQPGLRLLTLTGPGGVGKTRLALAVASAFRGESSDGVAFVNLAPITDPLLVPPAIAFALGMPPSDSTMMLARLAQAIGPQRVLLVMDNFEQVISAGVLVSQLLSQCPNLKALVTSRMPLRVQGEQEMAVPTFPIPDPGGSGPFDLARIARNDAVTLFVQRAQASRRDFTLSAHNAPVIAEICTRLDGLPLAIELAAARMKIFSPQALLDRLSDRMRLLTGGARDLPSRLQTMRDAIQWSYDLLSPEEQALFRRLAIFSGSFSFPAATKIVGPQLAASEHGFDGAIDVVEGISSLIDKSLISRGDREDGEPRFRMLETIREFGLSQLRDVHEDHEISLRVLVFFADLARDADAALIRPEQAFWMQQLDEELANLRLALQIALDYPEEGGGAGLQVASGLWRYWLVRGQLTEGSLWLERMLGLNVAFPTNLLAPAINNLGNLFLELGKLAAARDHYLRSRELYASIDDTYGIADELNNLGLVELIGGNFTGARRILAESLAIRRLFPDRLALPVTLCNLGDIATFEEDYDLAERYHTEAYEIRIEIGNRRGVALSCNSLGLIAFYRGDLDLAERWFAEGMGYANELSDAYSRAILQVDSGLVATARKNLIPALELMSAALKTLRQMGSRRMMAEALDAMAEAAILARQYELAARLLGGGKMMRAQHKIAITTRSHKDFEILSARLSRRLGEDTFLAQLEAGRLSSYDTLFDEALGLLDAVRENGVPAISDNEIDGDGVPVNEEELERLALTPRERDILALLFHGFSDKDIAEQLFISPRTAMT
ncbi:MAG: helix-turn-helix transcriptional regulator, partial [Thermomicrobiales bacterium]